MCLAFGLIPCCRGIFSVSESLPEWSGRPVPAGPVGKLYPLQPVYASADERLPAAQVVKVQRSAECFVLHRVVFVFGVETSGDTWN